MLKPGSSQSRAPARRSAERRSSWSSTSAVKASRTHASVEPPPLPSAEPSSSTSEEEEEGGEGEASSSSSCPSCARRRRRRERQRHRFARSSASLMRSASCCSSGGRRIRRYTARATSPCANQSPTAKLTASPRLNPCENPPWYPRGKVTTYSPGICTARHTATPCWSKSVGENMTFFDMSFAGASVRELRPSTPCATVSNLSASLLGTPYHVFGAPAWWKLME
mmetsp:Transcript_7662/g.25354  ORF Transcript_7662/g.25354 Transcript_7662/m.25354 type:complete len:224 (-) Transcript_7662:663-1334(-)